MCFFVAWMSGRDIAVGAGAVIHGLLLCSRPYHLGEGFSEASTERSLVSWAAIIVAGLINCNLVRNTHIQEPIRDVCALRKHDLFPTMEGREVRLFMAM